MSNFGTLKEVVLACVTRANTSFQAGTSNFADVAINNALIYAQRRANFEWCKGTVSIMCNPKGSILSAVDDAGQPVVIKNIIKCFGQVEPTGHKDLAVPYLSRVSQIGESGQENRTGTPARHGECVIHQGQIVYASPAVSGPYTLWFEAVKWMPRLVFDTDTNFLFTYGFDFLMYRSIVELNFFIKEDERFNVSAKLLEDAWNSLVQWDASLVSPTETEINI